MSKRNPNAGNDAKQSVREHSRSDTRAVRLSDKDRSLQAAPSNRIALLVLGMHRSGTSAVTRCINLLGADNAQKIMEPNQDNPEGYWEPSPIVGLHEEILHSLGSTWDDISTPPKAWFSSASARQYQERLKRLLDEEYTDSSLFVVKDPRLSRFLPLWLETLNKHDIEARCIMTVRNPLEVAASLKKRNNFITAKSLLLWLDHTLQAEIASRGYPRAIVHYEDLLKDWQGTLHKIADQLGIQWARWTPKIEVQIEHFLSSEHRHHSFERIELDQHPKIADWIKVAYGTLCSRTKDDGEIIDALDLVRAQIRTAERLYAPIIQEQQLNFGQRVKELETKLEQRTTLLQDQLATEQEQANQIRAQLTQREQRINELEQELEQQTTRLKQDPAAAQEHTDQMQQRAEALEGRNQDLASKLQVLEAQAGNLKAKLETGEAELGVRVKELDERVEEAKALRQRVVSLAAQLSAVHASRSWRITAPLRFVRQTSRRLMNKLRAALSHIARTIYRRAPLPLVFKMRIKDALFRRAAPLFRHIEAYQHWEMSRRQMDAEGRKCRSRQQPRLLWLWTTNGETCNRTVPLIAYQSHDLKWQGAPNSLFEIASGIARRNGFRPTVIARTDGPLSDLYRAQGIDVLIRDFPERGLLKVDKYERQLDALAQTYIKLGARLVHANTLRSFYSILAAHRARIPSIWNVRESEDPDHYFNYLPNSLREMAYTCFSLAEKVVFVAASTRERWKDYLVEGRHTIIRNGLDLSRLMRGVYGTDRTRVRLSMGLGENDVLVLSVGTVCERKGQLDLVDALARVDKNMRQHLVLAIIGFGMEPYAAQVRQRLRSYKSEGLRVHAIDETKSEEGSILISQYYLASDIFIFCSRLESYPRVILEAMAFDLAIVTTPCFGVTEQIVDGQSGLVYLPSDIDALAKHVSRLSGDAGLRRQLGRAARDRLSALNSYDQMLDSYEMAYRSLIC